MRRSYLSAILGLALAIASCSADDLSKASEVQAKADRALPLGSEQAIVERELKKLGIGATFDKFQSRYQGIIRSPSTGRHAILVYVYLDSHSKVSKVEAIDSFTGP